jgi:hypothetical protein
VRRFAPALTPWAGFIDGNLYWRRGQNLVYEAARETRAVRAVPVTLHNHCATAARTISRWCAEHEPDSRELELVISRTDYNYITSAVKINRLTLL